MNFHAVNTFLNTKNYRLVAKLGEGKMSEVYLVIHTNTGSYYAVKVIHNFLDFEGVIHREVILQRRCLHPRIIQIKEYFRDEISQYIVMEYCQGGHIYEFLQFQQWERYPENIVAKIIYQISDALTQCLNPNNFIHGDIKPENILFDDSGNVKLGDFGSAWSLSSNLRINNYIGSLEYQPPELLFDDQTYNDKVDVWSLGVLCYELLTGSVPFRGSTKQIIRARIGSGLTIPDSLEPNAQDFIQKLLVENYDNRLSIEELKVHPWINSHYREDWDDI